MIESINNEQIKEIRKLKDKKYRDESNLFLVEGDHLVKEAYKAGYLVKLILTEDIYDFDVEKLIVTDKVINSISDLNNVKVIGVCKKISSDLDLNKNILILDGVQDPGNLGTIIRSCVAFNIENLVLSNETVDLYNSKVIRSTQGMNFHINIVRDDLKNVISLLKDNNYTIYGTNVINGIDIKDVKNTEKYAIILGNEGNGISDEVNALVDKNIYIKMNDKCESLNVAVSGSIILYELNK
ncbi:MAG: RNA methyltransferase [Bacilli bacterium]|nr:RNA methyltransferase [Bacilli bacterium]